ncbi:protocatechuate 3,4-dioxygenase subunit beta [Antarctobacter sp.]|uniref:dioxygenase family protein n=1 Tax=Antarctobacter sp. TaxID=1872577 RepID=UPI002B266ECA|nr:protocatechuate 3,4-dioxygenase subunit beta [Antarctobacter sp.]
MRNDAGTRMYDPWPEGVQPSVPIEGYTNTWTHTPSQTLYRRPVTRTEATGPADLWRKMHCGDSNLASSATGKLAQGALMLVSGRILDEDGRPIPNAIVELWQANAAGRYAHSLDNREAPLDPNFLGHGRVRSDENGGYAFLTIKPGAYPVPVKDTWWRPPHIHFSVLGPSSMSRLVTQMYFPGDPLNDWDRILHSVGDPAARDRLIAKQLHPAEVGVDHLGFHHDIVLRGRAATPEA